MAFVFVYTRKGDEFYSSENSGNYPGLTARNSDVFDAMHLAVSRDGREFIPMRNNTGVLFPRADFTGDKPAGTTKTLREPWVFRRMDGTFGVCAIRRNEDGPDPQSEGAMMLFWSKDFIRYQEVGFLKLSEGEIHHPRCEWKPEKDAYYVEWETSQGIFGGYTKYFHEIEKAEARQESAFPIFDGDSPFRQAGISAISACQFPGGYRIGKSGAMGIADAVPGNILEISEEEARNIEKYLGKIQNIGVEEIVLEIENGKKPAFESLPGAVCLYSDGSIHKKRVCWDREAFEQIDVTKPGKYEIGGEMIQEHYPFPFKNIGMSDPCIYHYHGRFILTATGMRSVALYISDTIKGLASAAPIKVYALPEDDLLHWNLWAQEFHVIRGVPYIFTTVGEKEWSTVRSHVLRCNGDTADKNAWEAPRLVVRPDGRELEPDGISLDMTYFCVNGVHYVMWSNRKFVKRNGKRAEAESADIYIAAVDPNAPWQLVTEPVCILRPMYGWDRYETEVDEGPYLLRHGDDLFVTISGSSTGLADLYCLGLLHAKKGNNLLSPDGWDWLPYPVLTKESIPGQFGPGHNSFVKDPESGDDLMVYHAVPHDKDGKTLGRYMGIRRVHWAASGYPYLEMTEEQDVAPAFRQVTLQIRCH